MPLFNVTLKDGASDDDLKKAKEEAINNGGTIKHEYTLIKGFTVEFPEDKVNVLTTNDSINVEADGPVSTQSQN